MPNVLILALALVSQADGDPFAGKVVAVADGDTITDLTAELKQVKVRLYGIDAPEIGQDFGARAKQAASDLAFGKMVTVAAKAVDRYGRTVAEVTLPDGRSMNREMVGLGMAWHYRKYAPGDVYLSREEVCARRVGLGLWSQPKPVPPWDWRAGKGRGEALAPGSVVGNRRSRLYHAADYRGGAKIVESNRVVFKGSTAAEAAGYRKAGDCR